MEQFDTLAADIGENSPYIIIGGDFNTLTEHSAEILLARFEQADLEYASAGAAPTFTVDGLAFTSDHIFTRGMTVLASGVWPHTNASDHFPVWVQLAINP